MTVAGTKKPHHHPTEQTRAEVVALASFGTPHEEIAAYLGISQDTLIRRYKEDLQKARTRANSKVAHSLYKMATQQNNVAAAIFWLKTRARWRETNYHDISSEDGSLTAPRVIEIIAGEAAKSKG